MQNQEHENYLFNSILSNQSSSEKFLDEYKNHSRNYFDYFKQELLHKYENKKLTDISGSKIVDTGFGETLQIVNKEKIDFKIIDNNFKNQINQNLKLLPKVGIETEKKLKSQGYDTIESLINHDKYKENALFLINQLDEMSFLELTNLLNDNKYSKKCRDNLIKCISLADIEDFKFMDIETLGLSNVPVILIGVAEIKKNNIISTQYFLRSPEEELSVINGYISHLNENSIHVTFNGKRFDVPFIRNRLTYHRLNLDFNLAHLDLLYFAKYLWKDTLPNCQLQTIEKYKFGTERVNDVPGEYIPDYYNTYLINQNIGPVIPIIEHNKQDIISLADFLMKMYEEVN